MTKGGEIFIENPVSMVIVIRQYILVVKFK